MTEDELAEGAKRRRRFKVRFYRVLFGRNHIKGRFRNELLERFRLRHPDLAGVLKRLKSRNFKHSSHLLQNFEATLVIYRICGRIMRELPDIPLYTKHDSLLTTPKNADRVMAIMREEFQKLGVRPTFKVTRYGDNRCRAAAS